MIEEPRRQGALLVLLLMSKEELVMDVKVRGSLGYRDRKVVGS